MIWAEIKSWTLHQLSHPGAPHTYFLNPDDEFPPLGGWLRDPHSLLPEEESKTILLPFLYPINHILPNARAISFFFFFTLHLSLLIYHVSLPKNTCVVYTTPDYLHFPSLYLSLWADPLPILHRIMGTVQLFSLHPLLTLSPSSWCSALHQNYKGEWHRTCPQGTHCSEQRKTWVGK